MVRKIKEILKVCLNPVSWLRAGRDFIRAVPHALRVFMSFCIFFVILIFFIVNQVCSVLFKIPLLGKFIERSCKPIVSKTYGRLQTNIIGRLEKVRPFQVRQSYLVEIAYQNLRARSSRTLITIFGMATGIGIIVYLLSLGYGIEKLVIRQVASLDELKIIDVVTSQNTTLRVNEKSLQKIKRLPGVQDVAPLISLVGRVNYNKAQTDVLVYAADQKFLAISKPRIKKGKLFVDKESTEDLFSDTSRSQAGDVAGAQTYVEDGRYLGLIQHNAIEFNVLPQEAVSIWSECDIHSDLLGFTSRTDAPLVGKNVWGGTYSPYSDGGRAGYDARTKRYLGKWISSKMPLFTSDADDNLHPKLDSNGHQIWVVGCIQENKAIIDSSSNTGKFQQFEESGQHVLGVSTDSNRKHSDPEVLAAEASASARIEQAIAQAGVEATGSATPSFITEVIATDSAGVEYVQLVASDAAQLKSQTESLKFEGTPMLQAVISSGLMKLLNIKESDVIGKSVNVQFIIGKSLRSDVTSRRLSITQKYTIVGLIDDDDSQYFYVPFSDIRKLGVDNFSQLKVSINNEHGMPKLRAQIEGLGYNTSSVVDTVAQIETLFGTLRLVLGAIGLIALGVASLGMFNTLTVSLLERTREIGGMKVIGMVSEEIQDLFLAEAMIMGFSGGIGGLLLGYILGQITSIIVSIFSLSQGLGYLQLTYIPFTFTLSILVLSFIVGILTGLYPAKRARSISALNALRYE